MAVAAKYKDVGYRAEITRLHKNLEADIYYVDYGKTERVPLSNIRSLKPEFSKFSVEVLLKCN